MLVQPIHKPKIKKHRAKVQKIILQETKACYVTGRTDGLHKHHIFFGNGQRALSEKYGLYVWLRPDWHNTSDYGVHFNPHLDRELKMLAQSRFEQVYGHDEFMRIFGRNYL